MYNAQNSISKCNKSHFKSSISKINPKPFKEAIRIFFWNKNLQLKIKILIIFLLSLTLMAFNWVKIKNKFLPQDKEQTQSHK